MQWGEDVDLSKMKVSGAPFSGPLALLRDTSKISIVSASTVRNSLNIYSSAGGLLAEIPWKRGKVVEMGWTEREKLIVVLDDGLEDAGEALEDFLFGFTEGRLIRDLKNAAAGVGAFAKEAAHDHAELIHGADDFLHLAGDDERGQVHHRGSAHAGAEVGGASREVAERG